jgi:DNA-binding transcriptional LysR family regulator|tara:strand:- start:771 stop:1676 length:906 start_codon:yes stop_codon:yes gene_type:complete
MRLEWLEDILAVLETGSFVEAARQRFLSQPAFSRRIRLIEDHIGVELFDRTKKPIQLKAPVTDQEMKIRELAARLHDLRNGLRRQDLENRNRIVIASQHAITTSVAPSLIKDLAAYNSFNTRLRSANRDECYALLMTRQVDLILIHHSEIDQIPTQDSFFQQYELDRERLIPVCATDELSRIKTEYESGQIPVVSYPADSFLGHVIEREVFSHMRPNTAINRIAETSLTLAILPLTMAGVGVAWIPDSLAAPDLANGRLSELSELFPCCELRVMAIRLQDAGSKIEPSVWETIASYPDRRR